MCSGCDLTMFWSPTVCCTSFRRPWSRCSICVINATIPRRSFLAYFATAIASAILMSACSSFSRNLTWSAARPRSAMSSILSRFFTCSSLAFSELVAALSLSISFCACLIRVGRFGCRLLAASRFDTTYSTSRTGIWHRCTEAP